MTAIARKIRDSFSDFWLDIELIFDRFLPKKRVHPKKINDLPKKREESDNVLRLKIEAPVIAKPIAKVVKKEVVKKNKMPFAIKMLRLSKKERLFFYDELSTLVTSGITLIDSLTLIKHQSSNKTLKRLYTEMIYHINSGLGLAETMAIYSHLFPSMQTALIEAGEESGNLKVVLEEIVEEMETQQDFYRKITGAMFYPAVLIILSIILVSGMMTFVIPKISKMYEQSHVELPTLTQIVINISIFVSANWEMLSLSSLAIILILWGIFFKTKFGRLVWESFSTSVPFFGTMAKDKNVMILASNMAMLLSSGVLITDAFEITEKTLGNLHYQREIKKIRHGIILGKTVSEMMGLIDIKEGKFVKNKLFPIQVAQLVHIGESTGSLDTMFYKIRDNYHKSLDYKLKNISTMIEPIMIFFVAALVGSILLAVMLPFFYIGTTIN